MRTSLPVFVLALALGSCASPAPGLVLTHTFPALDLAPGDEVLGVCQSWTLHNDEELFVNAVEMSADPGWHHSNWMFVPEDRFPGTDGSSPCTDLHFNEVGATFAGGGVLFAQSTQSTGETQAFPEGAAIRIPPHSRVIGSVHVIDATPAPLHTAITLTLVPIAAADVRVHLSPLLIDDRAIAIPPRSEVAVTTACDVPMREGRTLYYVLPHFHARGVGLRVSLEGGAHAGEVAFETTAGVGQGLGGTIDPPLPLGDATGLRITCTYRNEGTDEIGYGSNASDEMCSILAYTALDVSFGGFASSPSGTSMVNGVTTLDAPCQTFTH